MMTTSPSVYRHISAMEPMLPPVSAVEDVALEVMRRSAALHASVHPYTATAIAELLQTINAYYSNLIEGHDTRPAAIERAIRGDISSESGLRARQLEARAHVQVSRLMDTRLADEPDLSITSSAFLSWLHREFYERMPEEYRYVRRRESGELVGVRAGELRDEDVVVGRHLGPAHQALPGFLTHFDSVYRPSDLRPLERIIAAAASHHRLMWIHPFLDGNGRVTRLFTSAYLRRAGVDAGGLWSVSRGLARRRELYIEHLANADAQRRNDYDGRGNLNEAALVEFCRFFLETALDQIDYMSSILRLDMLDRRITAYVELRARGAVPGDRLPEEAALLLAEVAVRGEVSRGDAARVLGMAERTGRRVVSRLTEEGLLGSETPKGPLRLGLPTGAAGYYFPRLFPEESAGVPRG